MKAANRVERLGSRPAAQALHLTGFLLNPGFEFTGGPGKDVGSKDADNDYQNVEQTQCSGDLWVLHAVKAVGARGRCENIGSKVGIPIGRVLPLSLGFSTQRTHQAL